MDKILSIDLGTTNSYACIYNNTFEFIKNEDNSIIFKSIIEFTKNGKKICEDDNHNCIKNIKRLISYNFKDNFEEYKSIYNINKEFKIFDNKIYIFNNYEKKYYSVEELHSLILKKIINCAEKQLNININEVIITIPAYFNDIQRNSILLSLKLISIDCLKIINEPTAASIAYSLQYNNDVNILVLDIGGGTTDISLLNIDNVIIDVLNTNGDLLLGGEDFTNKLYIDLKKLNYNLDDYKLKELCDKLKCKQINKINLNNFEFIPDDNYFNNIYDELLHKIEIKIDEIINLINFSIENIDYIILVGGGSKLDNIYNLIKKKFNKKILNTINNELAICMGASLYGNNLLNNKSEIVLIDIVPLSIGVESNNGLMCTIIEKGSKLPIKNYKYFCNEKDNQLDLDILIYQGENKLVKDNILIGNFKLCNLKLKEKNKNIIKIEIKVNVNGIIEVYAYEKGTSNFNEIRIHNYNKLTNDEILKITKELEKTSIIDNYKFNILKLENEILKQLKILKYNCYYNNFIKLDENEKIDMDTYIKNLQKKFEILKNYEILENKDYEEKILNYKKIIKLNNNKYKMLIDDNNNYDINEYKYELF